MNRVIKIGVLAFCSLTGFNQCKQTNDSSMLALFQYDSNSSSRWISFENPSGLRGELENC